HAHARRSSGENVPGVGRRRDQPRDDFDFGNQDLGGDRCQILRARSASVARGIYRETGSCMKDVLLYDTTLRDGCQAEDISFTLEDKLRIAEILDELGIDYIEGGYPGSNERDADFFKQVEKLKLRSAKIAAFGTTAKFGIKPSQDS